MSAIVPTNAFGEIRGSWERSCRRYAAASQPTSQTAREPAEATYPKPLGKPKKTKKTKELL